MAIEISPSDEHEPDGRDEPVEGESVAPLQPVPPQDSPTQFYEWALRREQMRLRKLILAFATFAALTLLLQAFFAYFLWDTRRDTEPAGDIVVQEDPNAASQASVDALQDELRALSDRVDRVAGAGVSEETLGEVAEAVDRIGRQLERVNRQSKAAIACLNGAIASLDEAVRDLLRQDISANEFVQRPAADCG